MQPSDIVIAIIWRYEVKSESARTFEELYGEAGPWVQLFSKSDDYVTTKLFCPCSTGSTYLTIDYWESEPAFQTFLREHEPEYQSIDSQCASLTRDERQVGIFMCLYEIEK